MVDGGTGKTVSSKPQPGVRKNRERWWERWKRSDKGRESAGKIYATSKWQFTYSSLG